MRKSLFIASGVYVLVLSVALIQDERKENETPSTTRLVEDVRILSQASVTASNPSFAPDSVPAREQITSFHPDGHLRSEQNDRLVQTTGLEAKGL